jgi:hypothetical protein
MLETAGPPPASLRAALRIGGVGLGRHQLTLALACKCERIVCLARALDPELVAMQHVAEQAGARFHVIPGARALVGLVTAGDEVFIIADGLLAPPDRTAELLEQGPAVLVQPIEVGLPQGFERIDLNHAAAGAMRIPGRLIERLADLPADCDVASALQRIALQGGVGQTMLPAALRDEGAWRLVRSEAEAQAAEGEWIKAITAPAKGETPTDMAIRRAVRAYGPALLHSGNGGRSLGATALAVLLLALVVGWFGWPSFAFIIAAVAWVLRSASLLLREIERQALVGARPAASGEDVFGWIIDAALALIIAWNLSGLPPGSGLVARAFPAVMLVALFRLLPRALDGQWMRWFKDRGLISLGLAAVALGGLRAEVIGGLAAGLAILGAAWPPARPRLTRA